MAAHRRTFSVEFKEKAVAYVVQQDKTVAEAARELGIGETPLRKWVSAARDAGRANTDQVSKETEELRKLRAQNRELQMRVELLKKAAAFFANEMPS
jgi:transposase